MNNEEYITLNKYFDNKILPDGRKFYTSGMVAKNTLQVLKNEHNLGQTGLLTRWDSINTLALKWFRFGNSYVIAGSSGTGKSYLLNMIRDDFDNKILNKNFKQPLLILAFSYEMLSTDETIRSISDKTGKSYSYYLGAEYIGKYKNKPIYNKITNDDKKIVDKLLSEKELGKRRIIYIETPSSVDEWYKAIKFFNKLFPKHKIVITYDHALLTIDNNNVGAVKLAALIGAMAHRIAHEFNYLVIILNQMNPNISESSRVRIPAKHYPDMGDGYGGNQLYFAVDYYIFLNKPIKYGIEKYGIHRYNTSIYITDSLVNEFPTTFNNKDIGKTIDIIHIYFHKTRFSMDSNDTFLLNLLYRGKLLHCPTELLKL